MTDTLRDRLGALVEGEDILLRVKFLRHRKDAYVDDFEIGVYSPLGGYVKMICDVEDAQPFAAQPAPAVMVEDDARKRLLYEPLGDFSFSQHVAAKLSTLLTAKYTNSQKIVAGIIKQEIEAVFREVDAEGRTAAAESREERNDAKKR